MIYRTVPYDIFDTKGMCHLPTSSKSLFSKLLVPDEKRKTFVNLVKYHHDKISCGRDQLRTKVVTGAMEAVRY